MTNYGSVSTIRAFYCLSDVEFYPTKFFILKIEKFWPPNFCNQEEIK